MNSKVFLMYAETELHAGKGMDIGVVDLPIQRERTTNFPIIQGVKGALRANINDSGFDKEKIFGSEPGEGQGTKPGTIAFSEAKILLFPVRNPEKLFVWVTCPLVLIRFLKNFEEKYLIERIENTQINDSEAVTSDSQSSIWLEDIKLTARKLDWLSEFAERLSTQANDINYIKNKLKKDIVVVNDNVFSQIVETMTNVIPRVRINREKGIVETGALWYEEYLPQDTVMYFVARETVYSKENELNLLGEVLKDKVISIGGKETLGKGLVNLKVVNL
ncbi:type III-B CRISPR module RAMP protein Cmr4 [Pseudothermotoga sp.]|uniref:type III-B CRISPR module RAMP protein Cmr4 n=1 Tax=Pseudothermotoga sp. TaxID=2033661 RepID=UPI000E955329|nr:type III-B CRISPR module RAMP protein Cmr4 [Pseudothermotoga sp.]HBJ81390.1 type III-B CRISPR module RAMP protein Cmr4 [Pseudothermotoga sp.]